MKARLKNVTRKITSILMILMCMTMIIPSGVAAFAAEDDASPDDAVAAVVEAPEESVEVDTGDGTYTVTLAETENGSISFPDSDGSTAQFAEGDEVEVDIIPGEGYEFSKITLALTDTGEIAAEDSDKDAASYTFTMPAADLTIYTEFTEASGDGTYTVTLAETENGSISFSGIEGSEAQFAEGDEVAVEAAPDDGFEFSGITLTFTETGEVAAEDADPDSESYTFTMPAADITVSAGFDEAAPPETLMADEVETDAVLENYIWENLNPAYIEYADTMDVVNGLGVKNTLFDGNYVGSSDTINSIMSGIEQGDDSQYSKFIAQMDTYVAVYNVNTESDYFVALADTMRNDSSTYVKDAVFAMNDNDGNTVNGCVYDYDTGLVYIPKSIYLDGTDYTMFSIQVQLMQVVGGFSDNIASTVQSSVMEEGDGGVDVYSNSANIFTLQTTVQAEAGLDRNNMVVSVNGVPLDSDDYTYNAETGTITIAESSASIGNVSVIVENETAISKLMDKLSPVTEAYAASFDDLRHLADNVEIPSWVTSGTALSGYAPMCYYSSYGVDDDTAYQFDLDHDGTIVEGYHDPYYDPSGSSLYSGDITGLAELIQANWGKAYTWDDWVDYSTGKKGSFTFDDYDSFGDASNYMTSNITKRYHVYLGTKYIEDEGRNSYASLTYDESLVDGNVYAGDTKPSGEHVEALENLGLLNMDCCHISESISGDIYNEGDWIYNRALVRFLYVDRDAGIATFSILTSEMNTQSGTGCYVIGITPSTGYLTLKKSSSNTSITDGNSCYNMAGIKFEVQDETGGTVGTLTCKEDGTTNTLELDQGTYTVIEDESSLKGTGYLMSSPSSWTVTVSPDKTTTLEVSDPPGNDPAGIEIYKESSEGTGPSLAGAEFTVQYFDGYYDDESSLPDTATRTWVIQTVENNGAYIASLSDSCKVSGDDWYYNDSGLIVLPLGTIAVTETKAAEGYLIDGTFTSGDKTYNAGETYVAQITSDGSAVSTSGGNTLTVTDKVIRGGVAVQKRDSQSLSTDPQGSGSFEGITMQITNDNDYDVIVDGTTYGPGEVVKTLVTDEDGYAATDSDTLPYGTYTIAETEIPVTDGYLDGSESHDSVSSTTSIQFDVEEDGVIVDLTGADNSVTDLVKRGDISLVKQDGETQDTMGPVEFEITSLTTGESHDFWTDENGDYSSDSTWNRHSYHTNEAEDEYSGLWFYGYADGEASGVEVDDSLGALPYDTYRLDELPCEANEGKELTHTTFTITRDVRTISLGTIDNYDLETPEPYLHSMAYAKATGTQLCYADGYETLIDDCFYFNLEPGVEYVLYGVAYDVDTGEPEVDHYGDTISAVTYFTPTESDGVEEQEFYFDVEDLSGHKVTFYERIYTLDENGEYVLVCAEPAEDYENESIYFPQLGTTLLDEATGTHYSIADGEITLVDTVAVSEVPQGTTVMVTGTLMKKSTGEAVIGSDGNPVTASETFVSTGIEEQLVEISFTFDASELDGDGVVAFEDLYQITDEEEGTGPLVGRHADIDDEGQTVTFPGIHTTATDADTGTHTSRAAEDTTIVDVVDYTGLTPGEEYTMTGTLMDQSTGEELKDSNGKTVTSEVTFTPESSDGSVEMTFTFDASDLSGTTIVVFEDLYQDGSLVATHSDITDVAQTVYIPEIHTNATDSETGTHTSNASESTTIVDEVTYSGLTPGEEYTMSGVLMDKDTGKELLDSNGNTVTSEKTFTPDAADGSIELEFTFDSSALAGTTVVVFEELYQNGIPITSHSDLTDVAQTVYFPEIGTTATDAEDGDKYIINGEATVNDEVHYIGLEPGRNYRMEGTLMDVSTGEAVSETVETDFVPDTAEGYVTVPITVDATGLAGHDLVVFEKVYEENDEGIYIEVASHEDINDEGQTVHVVTPEEAAAYVKTGESNMGAVIAVIGCIAAAAIVVVVVVTVRRRRRTI